MPEKSRLYICDERNIINVIRAEYMGRALPRRTCKTCLNGFIVERAPLLQDTELALRSAKELLSDKGDGQCKEPSPGRCSFYHTFPQINHISYLFYKYMRQGLRKRYIWSKIIINEGISDSQNRRAERSWLDNEEKTSCEKNNMRAADSYAVCGYVSRHFLWSEGISDVSGRYFPEFY